MVSLLREKARRKDPGRWRQTPGVSNLPKKDVDALGRTLGFIENAVQHRGRNHNQIPWKEPVNAVADKTAALTGQQVIKFVVRVIMGFSHIKMRIALYLRNFKIGNAVVTAGGSEIVHGYNSCSWFREGFCGMVILDFCL